MKQCIGVFVLVIFFAQSSMACNSILGRLVIFVGAASALAELVSGGTSYFAHEKTEQESEENAYLVQMYAYVAAGVLLPSSLYFADNRGEMMRTLGALSVLASATGIVANAYEYHKLIQSRTDIAKIAYSSGLIGTFGHFATTLLSIMVCSCTAMPYGGLQNSMI